MALIVEVRVNAQILFEAHVQRVRGQPHQLCTYALFRDGVDLGIRLRHHYDDGAEALVEKMMRRLARLTPRVIAPSPRDR